MLVGAEKSWLTSAFMHNKSLSKLGIEGNFIKLTKHNYNTPTANIIFNGEMSKDFPLRSGTRLKCPFSLFLHDIELEV